MSASLTEANKEKIHAAPCGVCERKSTAGGGVLSGETKENARKTDIEVGKLCRGVVSSCKLEAFPSKRSQSNTTRDVPEGVYLEETIKGASI